MKKSGCKRTVAIIICSAAMVFMIAVSWYFTSQTGLQSNEKSFKTVHCIENFVGKYFAVDQNDIFWTRTLNMIIRKMGHFLEYLIMGLFISTLLKLVFLKRKHTADISIMICLALSLLDEFRQIFITGRTARLFDVFIDMSGAVTGILLASILYSRVFRNSIGRNKNRYSS